jgi:hypothetical protein
MLPKLNTPSVVELNLRDYNANGATISSSEGGTKFAFTIGPMSDAVVAALESAAQKHVTICLYCCGQPLLFDLVELERKEPRKARLVGRIVGGVSYVKCNTA